MDYSVWDKQSLHHMKLHFGRQVTAIWHTPDDNKPLALLVHGITGDHYGLVPLAAELAKEYRIVIADLPGHGKSGPLPLHTAAALQDWFVDILGQIERQFGRPAFIAAHSFGCLAVADQRVLRTHKVILICPVPTPSHLYAEYSKTITHASDLFAYVYNWRLFVLVRGMVLAKIHTREARRRVLWVGRHSKPSYLQVRYQANLGTELLDTQGFTGIPDGSVWHVICGLSDTTAAERDSLDMEGVFPGTPVTFLRGGHLLPIETPERVAEVITGYMVD